MGQNTLLAQCLLKHQNLAFFSNERFWLLPPPSGELNHQVSDLAAQGGVKPKASVTGSSGVITNIVIIKLQSQWNYKSYWKLDYGSTDFRRNLFCLNQFL